MAREPVGYWLLLGRKADLVRGEPSDEPDVEFVVQSEERCPVRAPGYGTFGTDVSRVVGGAWRSDTHSCRRFPDDSGLILEFAT